MTTTTDARTALLHLLARVSFRLGSFTLSSGATSDYYIDCRTTTLHAEGGRLTGMAILDVLEEHGLKPAAVGGLTMGADPVVSGVAKLAGEVLLNGADIYAPGRRLTETRRRIGMVFQKPNPFPAMSIADNVTAGLKLTGTKVDRPQKAGLIETSLRRAGLWDEVKDRLNTPGASLSGGQQQRLCIARSLAVNPQILLMDEPCSALDPTSTNRVEQTIAEISQDVTVVIVTHNMQQAARVSQQCAFFLASQGTPGKIVEAGPTYQIFSNPSDPRTSDYVNGRFG